MSALLLRSDRNLVPLQRIVLSFDAAGGKEVQCGIGIFYVVDGKSLILHDGNLFCILFRRLQHGQYTLQEQHPVAVAVQSEYCLHYNHHWQCSDAFAALSSSYWYQHGCFPIERWKGQLETGHLFCNSAHWHQSAGETEHVRAEMQPPIWITSCLNMLGCTLSLVADIVMLSITRALSFWQLSVARTTSCVANLFVVEESMNFQVVAGFLLARHVGSCQRPCDVGYALR